MMEKSLRVTISIVCSLVIIVCIIYGTKILLDDVTDQANAICFEHGLEAGCTSNDICALDCEELNKTYYKFEPGRDDNCWCRVGDSTEQIW
jgi:hypothetical protein